MKCKVMTILRFDDGDCEVDEWESVEEARRRNGITYDSGPGLAWGERFSVYVTAELGNVRLLEEWEDHCYNRTYPAPYMGPERPPTCEMY